MADYTAAIIAVTGTLLGAAITGGIQGILSSRAHQQHLERDKAARAFELATTKRERLLQRYETVALALDRFVDTVDKFRLMLDEHNDGTTAFNYEVFHQLQTEAQSEFQKLKDSVTLLALENDPGDVSALCRMVVDEFKAYMQDESPVFDGGFDQYEKFYERVVQLRQRMRENLHELEKTV